MGGAPPRPPDRVRPRVFGQGLKLTADDGANAARNERSASRKTTSGHAEIKFARCLQRGDSDARKARLTVARGRFKCMSAISGKSNQQATQLQAAKVFGP